MTDGFISLLQFYIYGIKPAAKGHLIKILPHQLEKRRWRGDRACNPYCRRKVLSTCNNMLETLGGGAWWVTGREQGLSSRWESWGLVPVLHFLSICQSEQHLFGVWSTAPSVLCLQIHKSTEQPGSSGLETESGFKSRFSPLLTVYLWESYFIY